LTLVTRVTTSGPEETAALGALFGKCLEPGDVVALIGDLGAGKTVFARGVARGLGCDPRDVQSPTFTLVREYQGRVRLYHLDLYRLDDPEEELLAIGYEEFFDSPTSVALVEWGERAGTLLPSAHFEVCIEKETLGSCDDSKRLLIFKAVGQTEERLTELRAALKSPEETPAKGGRAR